jgi:hypothetical protein
MKKTKSKPKTKPQGRGKRSTRPAAPVAKPRPLARMHRATASPAQRKGAELTRFLRIHAKRPFARRGEAIRRLAIEAAHLGRIELGAAASVPEN